MYVLMQHIPQSWLGYLYTSWEVPALSRKAAGFKPCVMVHKTQKLVSVATLAWHSAFKLK